MPPVRALLIAALAVGSPLVLGGCGGTTVNRTDTNAQRDLSGNWNATDSQQVAAGIIADITADPWVDKFREKFNRDPVIKVGSVKNRSNEDISTNIFTNDIRKALRKTGKVEVVASSGENQQSREERKDQDVQASADTRKESFQETGADFLLQGAIEVQHDQDGSEKQKFYAVDLELTDIKSQKLVWEGGKKIAKDINRSKYK
ncbi:MAG: penicillin-binding protein activator LpoB [Planctomycetes bacterium]|nr:penicillin-binding protein activator LpoB [Planctomycetota bacterium]